MDCSWIELGVLAAGSMPLDDKDIHDLHEQGIRAVLSLIEQPLNTLRTLSGGLFDRLGVTYSHVPIRDQFPPDMDQAHDILRFLDEMREQHRPVFVHCRAGIGRTGTVLHLYYLAQRFTFEEAAARVYATRPQCILLSDVQKDFLRRYAETLRRVV